MIEESFWRSWLAFWFLSGPILLCFGSLALSFYLSGHPLDAMLEALKSSRGVAAARSALLTQGRLGRLLLISKITGWVIWSGPGIRSGEIDKYEIDNFPLHLRRLLNLKTAFTAGTFTWLIVVFVSIKLK